MKTRDKTVLATLVQNGYDFNFIANPHMKVNKKLEAHFRQMAARFYETQTQQYDGLAVADKQQAFQRLCLTLGIDAAWWWENRRDPRRCSSWATSTTSRLRPATAKSRPSTSPTSTRFHKPKFQ